MATPTPSDLHEDASIDRVDSTNPAQYNVSFFAHSCCNFLWMILTPITVLWVGCIASKMSNLLAVVEQCCDPAFLAL